MTEKISSIARNTSYFTLALVLQKIISLAYFTMYARVLGPADLGQYYFAVSITSIFSIFIDFGLGNILTREIAKDESRASSLANTILTAKLFFSLATLAILFIWTGLWHYDPLTKQLIYISSIAMVLDNFTGIFYAILRGYHNLKFESIASVIFQLIVLGASLIVININGDIRWLMASLGLASLFNLGYSWLAARRLAGLHLRLSWDAATFKQVFLLALPFAIYAIFQRFYTYFDSVLLFKFAGDQAVGLYQVPFKIVVAIQFLPMAFTASLYPALSAYWQRNREQLAITFERAISYSLILSIPIMIGTIVLADQIITIFKESFSAVAWPLQVTMLAVPFMFLGFPVGSLLNACDRQKRNTINIAITSIASAALNFYLIPKWGVMGACVTNLITSIVMLGLGWLVIPQIFKLRLKRLAVMVIKVSAAGICMGIGVYLLKSITHPIVNIVFGALLYLIALFVFRGFTKEDIQSVLASFVRPNAKTV